MYKERLLFSITRLYRDFQNSERDARPVESPDEILIRLNKIKTEVFLKTYVRSHKKIFPVTFGQGLECHKML